MPSSDAAMDTDEGEKEVPAKKPKTEPVLVRHLSSIFMLTLQYGF